MIRYKHVANIVQYLPSACLRGIHIVQSHEMQIKACIQPHEVLHVLMKEKITLHLARQGWFAVLYLHSTQNKQNRIGVTSEKVDCVSFQAEN